MPLRGRFCGTACAAPRRWHSTAQTRTAKPQAIGSAFPQFAPFSCWHAACFIGGMRKYKAFSSGLAVGLFGLVGAFVGCSGSVSTGSDGCNYNGKSYAVGDKFPASDGCNQCSCGEGGEAQCTLVGCEPGPDSGPYCSVGAQRYAVGQQVSNDGCNTCTCTSSGQIACTERPCPGPDPSCASLSAGLAAALASAQKCFSAAECGQPIQGTSCGCTRDAVARKDADLTSYRSIKTKLVELGCEGGGGSTCDCPNADGFACVDNVCGWNYVSVEPPPDPACQPRDPGELCVRGTPTTDGELLAAGDPLRVTVHSSGCLSSSCSKVVTAACMISSGSAFDVKADFCVADTSKAGQGCTADCGTAKADCSFGQPLTAGEHQVKLGSIAVGFQVPSKLPLGGLCASTR